RRERRIRRVAPEVAGSCKVRPFLVDVAHHQVRLVVERDVTADRILACIDRLELRRGPVADAGTGWIRVQFYECQPSRAKRLGRMTMAGEPAGCSGCRTTTPRAGGSRPEKRTTKSPALLGGRRPAR